MGLNKINIFIRDELKLEFGRLDSIRVELPSKIEVSVNIFNELLIRDVPKWEYKTILRSGNGIKTFKSEIELLDFLSHYKTYEIYSTNMIHKQIKQGVSK
jgi:hypothetical protein